MYDGIVFYDHFTQDQICGVFTPTHFIILFVYFAALAVALFFSRKIKNAERIVLIIAVAVTCMEVVKIALRLYKGGSGDAWIPLYFSSLFLYAIWLSLARSSALRTAGLCFLAFGGTVAGTFFIFYPSTSLASLPWWHPGALHSVVYHWLMLYVGIVTLKFRYRPESSHFFHYFIFVTVFSAAAFVCNECLGTNLMFLGNPFGLEFLRRIYEYSRCLYALTAYCAQAVLLFWVCYGLSRAVAVIRKRREVYG